MKIIELQAENIKRLSAVEIKPDGPVVKISGKNAAGKSSVLDSIAYTLGGKSLIPSEPLRRGEKKGHVSVTLDGDEAKSIPPLTITRTFTDKGTTSLKVTTADGMKPGSPQSLLDSLCGRIAFDPLEFTRMNPASQAETLRGLVGLDFTAVDAERGKLYSERTEVNREAKAIKTRLDSAEKYPDAPADEVSVSELVQELQRRQEVNRSNADARQTLRVNTEAAASDQADIARHSESIAHLECQLAEHVKNQRERIAHAKQDIVALEKDRVDVAVLVDEDAAEVEKRIGESEKFNHRVRANAARAELAIDLDARENESAALTIEIEAIDANKQDQLEAAEWPVAGLGFAEDGITFNGLPFEQASRAEQVRVSMATALAMNPTLRVLLIRDASLLDEDSLQLVTEMATDADAQVWLECVGEQDECAVVIEDGRVKQA